MRTILLLISPHNWVVADAVVAAVAELEGPGVVCVLAAVVEVVAGVGELPEGLA